MTWKAHKDVQFVVSWGEMSRYYSKWDDAVIRAFAASAQRGGDEVVIDVLIYGRAGAKAWMGAEGVRQYDEDPEASVFQRFSIRANDEGRIP